MSSRTRTRRSLWPRPRAVVRRSIPRATIRASRRMSPIASRRTRTRRASSTRRCARVKQEDYDTVFYPGGHGPMWDLAEDPNDRGNHRAHGHTDVDQHGLRQLKAGLDCLGYRVGSANAIEMRRMRGIPSARNYQQILPFPSRRSHQFVGSGRVVQRYHQSTRGLEMQAPQQIKLRYITKML